MSYYTTSSPASSSSVTGATPFSFQVEAQRQQFRQRANGTRTHFALNPALMAPGTSAGAQTNNSSEGAKRSHHRRHRSSNDTESIFGTDELLDGQEETEDLADANQQRLESTSPVGSKGSSLYRWNTRTIERERKRSAASSELSSSLKHNDKRFAEGTVDPFPSPARTATRSQANPFSSSLPTPFALRDAAPVDEPFAPARGRDAEHFAGASSRGRSRQRKSLPHLSPVLAPTSFSVSLSRSPSATEPFSLTRPASPLLPSFTLSMSPISTRLQTQQDESAEKVIEIVTGRIVSRLRLGLSRRATHPTVRADALQASSESVLDNAVDVKTVPQPIDRRVQKEEQQPLPILSRLPESIEADVYGLDSLADFVEDGDEEDENSTAGTSPSFGEIATQPKGYLKRAAAPPGANNLYTRARLPQLDDTATQALWVALHGFRPIVPSRVYLRGYLALGPKTRTKPAQLPPGHPIVDGADVDTCPAFTSSASDRSAATLAQLRANFNWASFNLGSGKGQSAEDALALTGTWYGVAFRSVRRVGSVSDSLYAADRNAHEEAVASGGLLFYWYGKPDNVTGENLATCVWTNRQDAMRASRLPMHARAAKESQQAFSQYDLFRYRVVKRAGETGVRIETWNENVDE